jgi:ribonuclease HI
MLCNSAHSMLQELWRCDADTQLKALTFMWDRWNVRNKANAGEAAPKPQVVCHRVEKLLIESLGPRKLNKPPKPPDIHRWSKPPVHHMKVNFDGAFDENTGAGGWGYVVRDQAGEFIAAGAGKSMNLKSALQSESVACLAAIDGANRIGANRIIFEYDSSTLVHALKSNGYDKATIGVLVKEARSLCILNFDSYAFSFSRRTCNSVAHETAKLGVHSESYDSFWEASAPNCIVKLLASDIAVCEV